MNPLDFALPNPIPPTHGKAYALHTHQNQILIRAVTLHDGTGKTESSPHTRGHRQIRTQAGIPAHVWTDYADAVDAALAAARRARTAHPPLFFRVLS